MRESWLPIIVAVVSALSALAAAFLGQWLGARSARHQRAHAYLREQLMEFYAPMAALRERIRVLSEFRARLMTRANQAWQETVTLSGGHVRDEDRKPHRAMIDDENRQLKDELLPTYRQMLDLFTSKYHLAEPDTRRHYAILIEFCEGWRRFMAEAAPVAAIVDVMPREEKLYPLYDDLAATTEQLRVQVQKGKHTTRSWWRR